MALEERGLRASHGFFLGRDSIEVDLGDPPGNLVDYPSVPRTIGQVLSSEKASLTELTTTLGVADLYTLLEVILIDAHNARILAKAK